jgi:activator of HSP90 ATPase
MKTGTIQQSLSISAPSAKIYELLLDAKKHGALTGSSVEMSNKINGKFSVFDGYCKGYNLELIAGKMIKQAWNFAEEGWPEKHYSICTFLFEEQGGKTKIKFTQTDVPEHKIVALKQGWKDFYWSPLKNHFKNA